MDVQKSYITHIGTAIPEHHFSQNELIDYFLQYGNLSTKAQEKLKKIYIGTCIDQRHFVLNFREDLDKYSTLAFSISERMKWYEQYASALGIQAIKNSGINQSTLQTITHLITVSCTGMYTPGIDVEIINACGIPSTVARTCIYFMGCAAMVNALKTADAICRSQPDARVLIVSVELCSLHFQSNSQDDAMIANALFSDGAACALVESQPLKGKSIALENFYSDLIKNTEKHMAWSIRNEGFMITLSAFIPNLLSLGIKQLITPMLEFYGLNLTDIDYFAIHPGGPKILQRIEDILNIAPDQNTAAHEILKTYGNMSSATILFILERLLKTIPKAPADNIVLGMAFGPGLTVESVLFKVTHD
ncbi:MAG: type III polyketide synthase [Legionellales bacterium]